MDLLRWSGANWFELTQTAGIILTFFFSAFALWREERARSISNLIAIKDQQRAIWKEAFNRPELNRVLKIDADLRVQPLSEEESLFVKSLILHLETVYQAIKAGMFVSLEGLQRDVRAFFLNPVPRAVWQNLKTFQNKDFVKFVEAAMQLT